MQEAPVGTAEADGGAGVPFGAECAACGSRMMADAEFCRKCGSKVSEERALYRLYLGIADSEALGTGAPIPAQWTRRRRCRDKASHWRGPTLVSGRRVLSGLRQQGVGGGGRVDACVGARAGACADMRADVPSTRAVRTVGKLPSMRF